VLATTLLALALFADPAPADGISLAPDPVPAVPTPTVTVPADPAAPGVGLSLPMVAGGALAGAAALASTRRKSNEDDRGDDEPLVVFVSGHGNASGPGLFAHLVALMGIDPSRCRYFDYRWADGGTDNKRASEHASIDETAGALDGYLEGLAALGRPIYLVGFSKGGAGIAELVARWDRGQPVPEGVEGAALLDPPIASGLQGWVQSLGTALGPLPDDGGYNPVKCSWQGCVDTRQHLGEASGVEVMVVRNPQAGITNFGDLPEGLRVYDASDGGPGFVETLVTRPWELPSRVSEAHMAVLGDPRVAQCINVELAHSGTCPLPKTGQAPPAGVIVHGPGNSLKISLNKML
jgi:hypothetical protein